MMVTIYTDDAGIEGKIGTSAYNLVKYEASDQHLGTEAQFNV